MAEQTTSPFQKRTLSAFSNVLTSPTMTPQLATWKYDLNTKVGRVIYLKYSRKTTRNKQSSKARQQRSRSIFTRDLRIASCALHHGTAHHEYSWDFVYAGHVAPVKWSFRSQTLMRFRFLHKKGKLCCEVTMLDCTWTINTIELCHVTSELPLFSSTLQKIPLQTWGCFLHNGCDTVTLGLGHTVLGNPIDHDQWQEVRRFFKIGYM